METVLLATSYILTIFSIIKILSRYVICDDTMTYPKVIAYLNVKDAEYIQSDCSDYAKRNPVAGRFTFT